MKVIQPSYDILASPGGGEVLASIEQIRRAGNKSSGGFEAFVKEVAVSFQGALGRGRGAGISMALSGG